MKANLWMNINFVTTNSTNIIMFIHPNIFGFILILSGVIYIIKPNIFRVGIWKKTSVAQQAL